MDWVFFITNSALFVLVLIVSFIVVRIGAIALQLTGLEWSLAKFQSLSCFTSTGFTTKEAELITGDPRRRRIASVLIVFGHAGLVTLIATFANTLNPRMISGGIETTSWRFVLALTNLALLVVAIYVIYRLFTNTKFAHKLTNALRKRIIKRDIIKSVSVEELVVATAGYGVSRIKIREKHPLLDKTLSESGLRKDDITVLAIIRGHKTMPNPRANAKILPGDELICFGKLGGIRKRFA